MKISSLFIFAMCVGCITGVARAATKCVALNSSTTCKLISAAGKLEWSATCTTGGTSVAISGIGGCSSQKGNGVGAKSDSIATSSTTNDNILCWCKMTNPAVTPWVLVGSNGSVGTCAYLCADACSYGVQNNAAFRSALFSEFGG